ncbi:MAG: IgGFc-binding protein [Candidatus Symbiothrix sp.]|nr:IgGFc-binding protein [Candidatus Symbiothrix sp.]
MKTKIRIGAILCLLMGMLVMEPSQILAQSGTTQGQDFWVTFGGNNIAGASDLTLQIKIVASKATTVTFTYTDDGETKTESIAAGGVNIFNPTKSRVFTNTSGTTSQSLHIHSTEAVSVYAMNQYSGSSIISTDATNILPENALGKNYYHLSYAPSSKDGYTVIATKDNTVVSENGTKKATLNKGGVYSNYGAADKTGTHITSNKPIAYFVTNKAAQVPSGGDNVSCLFQQLYPANTWGKTFFVPVIPRESVLRGTQRVRILASEDGTTITQSGGILQQVTGGQNSLSPLNAGEFVELLVDTEKGCYISSTKPVAVCSYHISHTSTYIASAQPDMAWIPPFEQSVTSTNAVAFELKETTGNHYAMIVTPTATCNSTKMGTNTLTTGWTDDKSGYSFRKEELGSNSASSISNPYGLVVLVYGEGSVNGKYESYYYPASSGAAITVPETSKTYLQVNPNKIRW